MVRMATNEGNTVRELPHPAPTRLLLTRRRNTTMIPTGR
jgi:hypothetical protein